MAGLSTVFGSMFRTPHSKMMRVVYYEKKGGPEVLKVKEVEEPKIKDNEVLIKVAATTVNRRDLWRRQGNEFRFDCYRRANLGLECSGVIVQVGTNVSHFKCGDEVCALLLTGGGYSEFVAVNSVFVVSAPKNVPLVEAAALPCAASMVWRSIFHMNKIKSGDTVLIHGAAGGVGSLAIQILKYYMCKVFATTGTEEKVKLCEELGADVCINYKKEDFSKRVLDENAKGVDYILDCSGKQYFFGDLKCLAIDGRLIIFDYQSSNLIEMSMHLISHRRIQVMGCNLFNSYEDDKISVLKLLKAHIWPAIERSAIKPIIYKTFKFCEAAQAHSLMEKNANLGKILLIP